jgi:hypothetical protein
VIGCPDDDRVVEQALRVQRVERVDEVGVRPLHQVRVEVEVGSLLLRRGQRPREVEDLQERRMRPRLAREVLVDRRRQLDVTVEHDCS